MAIGLPNATTVTSMNSANTYLNSATGGIWGASLLFSIVFILFYVFQLRTSPGKALLASSFISTLVALLLRAMPIIEGWNLIAVVMLTLASAAYVVFME